jgi:hypothetical protein
LKPAADVMVGQQHRLKEQPIELVPSLPVRASFSGQALP